MDAAYGDLREAVARDYRAAEADIVERLRALQPGAGVAARIQQRAVQLAARVRATPPGPLSAESFLRHYGLSTPEGVALMCVAEALLRIPDRETADALIQEKFSEGQWGLPSAPGRPGPESGVTNHVLSSAADWALLLTGKLARWQEDDAGDLPAQLRRVAARLGEPVVRAAVRRAMRILAEQFVLAETIEDAVRRGAGHPPYRHSYDMLGEAARTAGDASGYFDLYLQAINAISHPDSISVKLSALHPRFEEAQRARVFSELLPRLRSLCEFADARGVGLTIDAEESERLELTLDLFDELSRRFPIGLAVQAYQKRALAVCDWLIGLRRRIGVRLVKGAYWDSEIKRAQQLGMPGYPVFTRKSATDVSYIACATRLLAATETVFPAFATHNCRTVATILELCEIRAGRKKGGGKDRAATPPRFEFQKLLGMGDALYDAVLAGHSVPVRVYAPVGGYTDLLPYLVRRLLENGANTSFVHQIADPDVPVEELVADPLAALPKPYVPDPRIPLPREIYPDRLNSAGLDLSVQKNLRDIHARIVADGKSAWPAVKATPGAALDGAIERAAAAFDYWSRVPAGERAAILERAADGLEARRVELVSLIVREGKRTYADAVAEVREAADFCRYYALQARALFGAPQVLRGPVGERNELGLRGRGVFACISPWNFPLAIFTGQVTAALAAGNAVIAKPAEQTPLLGLRAIELLQEAGLPAHVAACVIGDGAAVGAPLVADPRISGVAFTGSVETAQRINRALAQREGAIAPLIAETGGVNAMLVDASALPEQVVDDVVISAFQSAGQRCSAQRILFVDEGAAARVMRLLSGALAELKVGDPAEPDTDIGPVIDEASHAALARHIAGLRKSAKLIGEALLPAGLPPGHYIAPVAFELPIAALPATEVFGPILHVATYRRSELDDVLEWIHATGYGLTLGIHSRIQGFVDEVVRAARVGNIYVNRSMIGAVVGVQPFGGMGLSGTGPKAGGPHYLLRFATEQTITVNTAVVGGVTELLKDEG
ncbi:MAG TPA: L-glutamate gamma-semialdehyde dehydrogenase [Burkholderiales bacterium]|nr:L-glutamate gamma-semialdehyde dehydrogenase [Burkholderiales bacterium]